MTQSYPALATCPRVLAVEPRKLVLAVDGDGGMALRNPRSTLVVVPAFSGLIGVGLNYLLDSPAPWWGPAAFFATMAFLFLLTTLWDKRILVLADKPGVYVERRNLISRRRRRTMLFRYDEVREVSVKDVVDSEEGLFCEEVHVVVVRLDRKDYRLWASGSREVADEVARFISTECGRGQLG